MDATQGQFFETVKHVEPVVIEVLELFPIVEEHCTCCGLINASALCAMCYGLGAVDKK